MKKLRVSWEGVHDSTGYLFSFAKSLSAAVKHSPYSDLAENVINGFKHKRFYAIRSVLHGSLGIAPGGLGFPET